ncbi:hypothetical protein PHAVU_001G106100 [Phaseolus vulgaris]|uniref:Uncharacterized protein n=1 Tax=Phaseolus vulgaris TaxID=3885 RepID=V7CWY0_PHAVU|nr:hypothetical protein PHAVU_001G106100g [Phaseolus vulgaris]ESW33878.1 hypothetical protein PHAVU_001G106100g [Phaseolus vulgaris]
MGLGPTWEPSPKRALFSPSLKLSPLRRIATTTMENVDLSDRNSDTKHLPYSKLMNKKARGMCFKCGEHYHPLHHCEEKQLHLLVIGDDEIVNEGEIIAIEVKEEENSYTLDCGFMSLFGFMNSN